jgi:hypothetical protein
MREPVRGGWVSRLWWWGENGGGDGANLWVLGRALFVACLVERWVSGFRRSLATLTPWWLLRRLDGLGGRWLGLAQAAVRPSWLRECRKKMMLCALQHLLMYVFGLPGVFLAADR